MKNYTDPSKESIIKKPEYFSIAFNAERSIEDELARVSNEETFTILASYALMFLYISVSLGEVNDLKTLFVRSFKSKFSLQDLLKQRTYA